MTLSWILWWARNQRTFCNTTLSPLVIVFNLFMTPVVFKNPQVQHSRSHQIELPTSHQRVYPRSFIDATPTIWVEGAFKTGLGVVGGIFVQSGTVAPCWDIFFFLVVHHQNMMKHVQCLKVLKKHCKPRCKQFAYNQTHYLSSTLSQSLKIIVLSGGQCLLQD